MQAIVDTCGASPSRAIGRTDHVTTSGVIDETLAAIDRLADAWAGQRDERFRRRHLERADFDAVASTGYLRLIVPVEHGGQWRSLAETGPVLVEALRRLARGDQSVALVAAMHPCVQLFWTANPEAPEPYREAWAAQRAEVFASALDGHFWGTITSEPGSGGDILRTKATATPVDGATGRYLLHGEKHFGSGSQIVSFMMTTAKAEDADLPGGFFLDMRAQPWDGSGGLTITRPWDGMGMKATQSHAVMLHGAEATAWAWPDAMIHAAPAAACINVSVFSTVVVAVVDAAMAEAERRLGGGRVLRPYEDVEWTHAQIGHWMLTQAHEGFVRTVATAPPHVAAASAVKAKMGMAATAEAVLGHVCRAVGGGAFSASSPFATWNEDVRALGYLRPPWALAFDQLIAARRPPS
jgi:alkylation response protein AidB-like acyl-CoA dehydrogenase